MPIPKKIADRIISGVKRFQPVLESAKARDINESDTVVIVNDILAEVFGYDKYSEITSEHAIRSTFCDLAIKLEGTVRLLIEVKAIGNDLKDIHVKQAVDYAANLGVDWAILTNGDVWRIYKITFGRPLDFDLVFEITFTSVDLRSEQCLQSLSALTKEGWQKSALAELQERKHALNRFYLGCVILSDPVIDVIRRELKRASPAVRIEIDEIRHVLCQEVIKRDVLEGDKADWAKRLLRRAANRSLRSRRDNGEGNGEQSDELTTVSDAPQAEPPSEIT